MPSPLHPAPDPPGEARHRNEPEVEQDVSEEELAQREQDEEGQDPGNHALAFTGSTRFARKLTP